MTSNLVEKFGKDVDRDEKLLALNLLLAELEADRTLNYLEPLNSTVFILGPPRSGTTLMSQLVLQSKGFAGVTNFAARFWLAPHIGMTIERDVGLHDEQLSMTYNSLRGRTSLWSEPNEFGYFWSKWFDFGQDTHWLNDSLRAAVDQRGIVRSVAAMEAVRNCPMVFKNNTWFSFQADLLAMFFPKAIFVACRRDAFFVAQSLWIQRLEKYGDSARWWSVRPPDYAEILKLPPLEQVARQAVSIEIAMEESLNKIAPTRVIDAEYNKVLNDPRGVVSDIAEAVRNNGGSVNVEVDRLPERFESRDRVHLAEGLARELRDSVDRWRELMKQHASDS